MNANYFESKIRNITGEKLYNKLKEANAIIAGGAIHSLITGVEVKDIDVYFRSQNECLNALDSVNVKSQSIKFITDRSVTFKYEGRTVQFIYFNFYYDAHAVFKEYDFSVCMGAYDFKYEQLITHENFYKDIASKKITINKGTNFPLITLNRVIKYSKKGYDFPLESFLELCKGINNFDYNDPDVVDDQTAGFYGLTTTKRFQYEPEDIDTLVRRKHYEVFEHEGELYDCYGLEKVSDSDKVKNINYIKTTFGGNYFYKHAKKDSDGVLRSYSRNNFVYKLGKVADGGECGLWGYTSKYYAVNRGQYCSYKDAVLIKIHVETLEDLGLGKKFSGDFIRGRVVKVYTKEEEEQFPF